MNDDDVSLAAAGGPQRGGVSRSEAVFVADTLPWSTLVELLRFFGCFGCGSGRGRSSRQIAAVAVVLSAGEVKPRARDQTSIAGGVPTPVAAPDKRSLCAPRSGSTSSQLGDCASPRVTPASRGRRLLSALVLQPNGLQLAICSALLLATSRSIAALVAQPSFPNGTGILGRLSLLDRAESGSLAEGAASATTQKPTLGAADFRFDRIISCKALMI